MSNIINTLQKLSLPLYETLYLTFIPLIFSVIFGFILATCIFATSKDGLLKKESKILTILNYFFSWLINVFRSIPYIILLIFMIPITILIVGKILGKEAALPSLIVAATPFYARMCLIAFKEVDKGTIEAVRAMGATNFQIITKVIFKESLPALVSGVAVLGINLVSYSAMAGAIGAGGLGYQAYYYGFVRRDLATLYISTILILVIVFSIQGIGDYVVKKIDKR